MVSSVMQQLLVETEMKPARSRRGSILVFTSIILTVLMGVVALAVDASNLQDYRHRMQTAVDAAAVAGAREIKRNPSISDANLRTFVLHDATNNGFTDGTNGIAITANHGPGSGPFASNTKYVEVLMTRAVPTFFMKLFGRPSVSVSVRAVAGQGGGGTGCIYNLGTANKAFETSGGNGVINIPGCDIYDNSATTSAFFVSSAWTVTAKSINVVGGASTSTAVITPAPTTGVTPVTDPLALTAPTAGSCVATNYSITSGSAVLGPGTYCGGIVVQNANVTFSAGLYVLKDGALVVKGTGRVTGTGVTFYNVGAIDGFDFTNTSHIDLTAPTSGQWAAVLIASNGVKESQSNHFESDDMKLNGIIYFPHQHLEWKGGGSGDYTILITDTVKFTGSSTLNSNFSSLPGGSPIPGSVSKAE
jgi:hypothetical protein